jgi:hypothetical protein
MLKLITLINLKELIKKLYTIKVPAYALIIVFLASYGLFVTLTKKPPLDTITIQLSGAERCIVKYPNDEFIYRYNTLNVQEYMLIYKICYGKLPEKTQESFDNFFKKYPLKESK